MINTSNVADVFPILMQDNETFDRLKNDFPGILADLVTFKENPNCSCKGRVFKFFTEVLEKTPNSLDKYIKDVEAVNARLQVLNEERAANNYAGRVLIVGKGEENWKAFSQSLVGKMFRMFSVVERENDVAVYFL
jgi:hypothetical protein